MDYINYEEKVHKIRKENAEYLQLFRDDLLKKGLTDKTIRKHINNIDFYINEFLNYYEPTVMEEGCYKVDEFLGDWFIRKAMWSNKTTIKENSASIKKFYKCMLDHHYIDVEDYKEVCSIIKEMKDVWIMNVEDYNYIDY